MRVIGNQHNGRGPEFGIPRVVQQNSHGNPKYHACHKGGGADVIDGADCFVARHSAQKKLNENADGRGERQAANGIIGIFGNDRRSSQPAARSEKRYCDGGCEKQFGQRRVRRGNPPGQQHQHGDPTQYALHADGNERGNRENAHPLAAIHAEDPDERNDGEQADRGRDHAVAVFIKDAAFHLRHQFSVGKRPVRDR